MIERQEQQLAQAQDKARQLLKAIEEKGLIVIGYTEKQISDRIYDLAFEMFGAKKHWHKRVVRTGENTLYSYKVDPPDRPICQGDLVYLDLGPVFDNFEGDIGKTYLLGNDPVKAKLIQDLERIFAQGKEFYLDNPAMTGAQLWEKVLELTEQAGWQFGNNHAGHIVGEFSHIQRYGDSPDHRINALNHLPMNTPGDDGLRRHWILEIHLVDKEGGFGGFFEDLISLSAN
jgi:Xaa-Pro aminopeptidase